MSKKVSELEELLKLLGADSIDDVQLCCHGVCGNQTSYILGIGANIQTSRIHTEYSYQMILTGGFKPSRFKYVPENINENNEWTYSEIFKIQNTTITTEDNYSYWSGGYIYITEDILKQLNGKVTVYSTLTCD